MNNTTKQSIKTINNQVKQLWKWDRRENKDLLQTFQADSPLAIHENWEKYIGSLWFNVINQLKIKTDWNIVIVAPWKANKIWYWLAQLWFMWKVYIIEPDNEALSIVKKKYENCLPNCEIVGLPFSLKDAADYLLESDIDCILSNHPIDDMILSSNIDDKKFKKIFQQKYGQEEWFTGDMWKELVADEDLLQQSMLDTVNEWSTFINKTWANSVWISQYKSYYFQSLWILEPDFYAKLTLNELASQLDLQQQTLNSTVANIDDNNYWDNQRWYIASV